MHKKVIVTQKGFSVRSPVGFTPAMLQTTRQWGDIKSSTRKKQKTLLTKNSKADETVLQKQTGKPS